MRFVNADTLIQVQVYDEEHEEWSVETMTVEECLARFADVPTIIEMDRPQGEWINDTRYSGWTCTHCNYHDGNKTDNFCSNCGARMFAKDINVPTKKGVDDGTD